MLQARGRQEVCCNAVRVHAVSVNGGLVIEPLQRALIAGQVVRVAVECACRDTFFGIRREPSGAQYGFDIGHDSMQALP